MVDLGVERAAAHQLRVIAQSRRPALIQHKNLVALVHRADALGDEEQRRAGVFPADGGAHGRVGEIVQRGAGIVQNQNSGIARQRPGDEQPLPLAAGEVRAPGLHGMVPSVVQRVDELRRLSAADCAPKLGLGEIAPEIHVVANGALKEGIGLERHAERAVQPRIVHGIDVFAV